MAILVILRVLALVQAAARGCYLEVILGVKSMSRQPPGGPRGGQIHVQAAARGPYGRPGSRQGPRPGSRQGPIWPSRQPPGAHMAVQAAARGLVQAAARGLVQAAARGTPGCQDLV